MKSFEFPELATVLAYVFGEYDVTEGGGGLEAHPRLTTNWHTVLIFSVTSMKRALEVLLSLLPMGYKISRSMC